MINLETHSKLTVDQVAAKAKTFFGPGGLGLKLSEQSGDCLTFEGGGGYVTVSLCQVAKGAQVNLVSQEWEIQVKEFSRGL